MGDDDHRQPRPRSKVIREPRHHLDIEMVGRLVEEQQVEVGDKCSGELHAPALTARHGPQPPREQILVESAEQAVEDLADRRIAGPLVHILARHDVLRHGHLRVETLRLRDGADVHPRVDRHPPGVRRHQPGHECKQRALARAIATDDRDALGLAHAEGHVIQQWALAIGLRHAIEVDKIATGHAAP